MSPSLAHSRQSVHICQMLIMSFRNYNWLQQNAEKEWVSYSSQSQVLWWVIQEWCGGSTDFLKNPGSSSFPSLVPSMWLVSGDPEMSALPPQAHQCSPQAEDPPLIGLPPNPHCVTSPDILLVRILSCYHPMYNGGREMSFFSQALSPLAKLDRHTY